MINHQSNIDEIKRFTVGIMRAADSNLALGTGVIVTDDGLIVTCYHVISDRYKKIISNTLYVSFPAQPGIRLQAQVLNECCISSLDIAFLQLQDRSLPTEARVANLSEDTAIEGHKFKSFGFRKQTIFKNGAYSPEGTIEGKVQKNFNNIVLPEVIQLTSDGIDHGMSGATVLDKNIDRVVGIVSEYLATSSNVDNNLALAIPVESIVKVCPIVKEKNPGFKQNTTYEKVNDSYYKHSQEISQIIYEGWSSMNIFCGCKYEDGKIERTNPEEPELKDIALARQHFQSGYEDLWQIKEKAKSESIQICSKIEQVFNSFKEIVYNELEKDFSYNNIKLGKLNRVGVTSFPSNRDDRVYIDMHVIDTIFSIIVYKERIQISEPQSTLIPIPEKNTDFTITQLNIPKGIIGYGDSLSMNVLKSRLEALSSNATIHSLLNEYILLQQCLEGNTKINKTWNEVQKIWKDVYHESQPIKGYCKRCPL